MNGTTGSAPRLVVGISRSRASCWALAWATGEARRRGARLLLVHVFRPRTVAPPGPYDWSTGGLPPDPDADRMAYGHRLIWATIAQAVGEMPRGVAVELAVLPGHPAVELARLARGGDVLVFGSRHRGWLGRHAPGSTARACARRAECPVVIVPEPSPAVLVSALPADAVRGHRHRWMPHREAHAAS